MVQLGEQLARDRVSCVLAIERQNPDAATVRCRDACGFDTGWSCRIRPLPGRYTYHMLY